MLTHSLHHPTELLLLLVKRSRSSYLDSSQLDMVHTLLDMVHTLLDMVHTLLDMVHTLFHIGV